MNKSRYLITTKKISIVVLFFVSLLVYSQQKYTISGTVKALKTGEALIGASISVDEFPDIIATSNEYGFYSLSLPEGKYTVHWRHGDLENLEETLTLDNAQRRDVFLSFIAADQELEGVVITKRKNDHLTKPQMGTETLSMKDIAKIPVLLGEKDILKTIQLLPGIKSAGEGSSGFSVRGGGTDQNLILLDEAPVYNSAHLLGFFSTFNSDAIKDVTIIKGNSPAYYGGRLSSVLDVKMKEGNNKNYNVSGGIGLISSRLAVEGPIQKEKSSFIISGRRTYADVFLKLTDLGKDSKLFFYDLNTKANYKINDKHHLYLSGYFGRDILSSNKDVNVDWGNTTGTLRWNYIINSKLFSNTSLIFSNYVFNIVLNNNEEEYKIKSEIQDWNLKEDLTYYLNPKNTIKTGFNVTHHTLTPSTFTGEFSNSNIRKSKYALECAIYVDNNWKINRKLSVNYGIRASAFTLLGGTTGTTHYIYNKDIIADSVVIKKGSTGKTFLILEPRIAANYRFTDNISLKAGYARNGQHLHLLSNSTGGNPTDQWVGNSYNIKPEIADQFSVGYNQSLFNNKYELGVETYYKSMQNQIDYKNAADVLTAPDVESQLLYGKGRAYGLELIFKKKEGKLTGWISYTLSKAERKIEGISNNKWYNSTLDRTHDLSIVSNYQITPKWSVSGVFVYQTGRAVNFPTGKYQFDGETYYVYGDRNTERMPAYHRLDISFTKILKAKEGRESSLSFGVYNTYGRQNAYFINFKENAQDKTKTDAIQTSLFSFVPNISYNFKF